MDVTQMSVSLHDLGLAYRKAKVDLYTPQHRPPAAHRARMTAGQGGTSSSTDPRVNRS